LVSRRDEIGLSIKSIFPGGRITIEGNFDQIWEITKYRLFGRTVVKVASLALGTANFGQPAPEEEAERILNRALDAGGSI
jgi:hypothetical protein